MENLGVYTPPQKASTQHEYVEGQFHAHLTEEDLEITPPAREKLSEIIAQSEDAVSGIRIYIGGGGCGGLSYGMTFTDGATEFDTTLNFDNLQVHVDVVALHYLRGAQIDYIQEVGRERFVFNNVFAATGGSGSCGGCGSAGG